MKRNKMICKVKSAFIFSMIKQFLIVQFIDGFKKKNVGKFPTHMLIKVNNNVNVYRLYFE